MNIISRYGDFKYVDDAYVLGEYLQLNPQPKTAFCRNNKILFALKDEEFYVFIVQTRRTCRLWLRIFNDGKCNFTRQLSRDDLYRSDLIASYECNEKWKKTLQNSCVRILELPTEDLNDNPTPLQVALREIAGMIPKTGSIHESNLEAIIRRFEEDYTQ